MDSDTNIRPGGFKNLDRDGNEVADKRYAKYAKVKTYGKRGLQVQSSSLNHAQ